MPSRTRCELKKVGWSSILVAALVLALGAMAQAQQPKKAPRIGFLRATSSSPVSARTEAFRQRLRELGYVEGKNIVIEARYTDARPEKLPDLAAELVRLQGQDIIMAQGGQSIRAAQNATDTIPIVTVGAGDLVGEGLVASLARPGGNVTGATNIDPDLNAKRLELLKETFPKLSRVAVLYHRGPRGDHEELKETQTAVRGRVMGSDVIFAIREESAGGGISYLIATMDSVIEVVANRLRIRGDDFHPCNSQFQSFLPFHRYAPFITGINPFQSFDVLKG